LFINATGTALDKLEPAYSRRTGTWIFFHPMVNLLLHCPISTCKIQRVLVCAKDAAARNDILCVDELALHLLSVFHVSATAPDVELFYTYIALECALRTQNHIQ